MAKVGCWCTSVVPSEIYTSGLKSMLAVPSAELEVPTAPRLNNRTLMPLAAKEAVLTASGTGTVTRRQVFGAACAKAAEVKRKTVANTNDTRKTLARSTSSTSNRLSVRL